MKHKKLIKEVLWSVITILLIYFSIIFIWNNFSQYIIELPVFGSIYNSVMNEINTKSLLGFVLINFFGSLFFILYPTEVIFMLYAQTGYNLLLISTVLVVVTVSVQIINYYSGVFIKEKIISRFTKNKKKEYLDWLKNYDVLGIVIINILPLPSDILTVILGTIKYDFKKTMIYSFIGRVINVLFLVILVLMLN